MLRVGLTCSPQVWFPWAPLHHCGEAASDWRLLIYSLARPHSEILLSLPPASQAFTNPKQLLSTPYINLEPGPLHRRQAVNLRLQGLWQGGIMGEFIPRPGINYFPGQEGGSGCSFG